MTDRLADAFASLSRVEAPIAWDDVMERADALDDDVSDLSDMPDDRRPTRLRAAAVAVVAAALFTLVVLTVRAEIEPEHTGVSTPSSVSPTTDPTPTTQAATSSFRTFPVTAWTGDLHLVWSGEDGSTQRPRGDGWAYDPRPPP